MRLRATVAMLLWTSLLWAGEQPSAPRSWWLASNLRVVTYDFLERGHRESDLSADEILNCLDRFGDYDLVLTEGFHYWKGQLDGVATLRVGDGPVDLGEVAELHQAVERGSPIPARKMPLSVRITEQASTTTLHTPSLSIRK